MPGGFESIKPAGRAFAVTPVDGTTKFARHPRGIYVGGAGNLAVTLFDPVANKDATFVFQNVNAGSLLPIEPTQVLATGTTASNIIAFL